MKKLNNFLIILWIFSFILPCYAFGKDKVLVLRVESNKLTVEEREKFLQQIIKKLNKYKKFEILKPPVIETMDFLFEMNCIDIDVDCMTRIGKSREADYVLYIEINLKEEKYVIRLQLANVKKAILGSPVEGESASLEKLPEYLNKSIEAVFGPEPKPKPVFAEVIIRTSPAGAEIYIDDDYRGLSPTGILKLKPGKYTLRTSKVGYQEIIETFEVEAGKSLTLNYPLKEVIVKKEIKKPVEEVVLVKKAPFYEKWWFWTIVGIVATGTGTGIYFLVKERGVTETGSLNISLNPNLADRDPAILGTK